MLAQFEKKIIKVIDDTVDSMTKTHEKDFANITETLEDIQEQLDEYEENMKTTTTTTTTTTKPKWTGPLSKSNLKIKEDSGC